MVDFHVLTVYCFNVSTTNTTNHNACNEDLSKYEFVDRIRLNVTESSNEVNSNYEQVSEFP